MNACVYTRNDIALCHYPMYTSFGKPRWFIRLFTFFSLMGLSEDRALKKIDLFLFLFWGSGFFLLIDDCGKIVWILGRRSRFWSVVVLE